jgi:hypothetical protein
MAISRSIISVTWCIFEFFFCWACMTRISEYAVKCFMTTFHCHNGSEKLLLQKKNLKNVLWQVFTAIMVVKIWCCKKKMLEKKLDSKFSLPLWQWKLVAVKNKHEKKSCHCKKKNVRKNFRWPVKSCQCEKTSYSNDQRKKKKNIPFSMPHLSPCRKCWTGSTSTIFFPLWWEGLWQSYHRVVKNPVTIDTEMWGGRQGSSELSIVSIIIIILLEFVVVIPWHSAGYRGWVHL